MTNKIDEIDEITQEITLDKIYRYYKILKKRLEDEEQKRLEKQKILIDNTTSINKSIKNINFIKKQQILTQELYAKIFYTNNIEPLTNIIPNITNDNKEEFKILSAKNMRLSVLIDTKEIPHIISKVEILINTLDDKPLKLFLEVNKEHLIAKPRKANAPQTDDEKLVKETISELFEDKEIKNKRKTLEIQNQIKLLEEQLEIIKEEPNQPKEKDNNQEVQTQQEEDKPQEAQDNQEVQTQQEEDKPQEAQDNQEEQTQPQEENNNQEEQTQQEEDKPQEVQTQPQEAQDNQEEQIIDYSKFLTKEIKEKPYFKRTLQKEQKEQKLKAINNKVFYKDKKIWILIVSLIIIIIGAIQFFTQNTNNITKIENNVKTDVISIENKKEQFKDFDDFIKQVDTKKIIIKGRASTKNIIILKTTYKLNDIIDNKFKILEFRKNNNILIGEIGNTFREETFKYEAY